MFGEEAIVAASSVGPEDQSAIQGRDGKCRDRCDCRLNQLMLGAANDRKSEKHDRGTDEWQREHAPGVTPGLPRRRDKHGGGIGGWMAERITVPMQTICRRV